MTAIMTAFAGAVIPSLFCGIVLGWYNKKATERYEEEKERAKERAEAAQIQMKLILASASLSYACAIALKRGETNGEVEEGVEEYELAKKAYLEHINSEYFKKRENAK